MRDVLLAGKGNWSMTRRSDFALTPPGADNERPCGLDYRVGKKKCGHRLGLTPLFGFRAPIISAAVPSLKPLPHNSLIDVFREPSLVRAAFKQAESCDSRDGVACVLLISPLPSCARHTAMRP
jgi:hypothetical protein